jgi:glutathione synthase/RimK-type ligase-like ATP-grasp enzyme
MELDPAIYGDWVVLKPEFKNSTGRDINMVPTKILPTLTLDDFPENHLMREDTYLVQQFIKTGEKPVHYRVTIFLNEILFSSKSTSKLEYPQPNLTCMLSTTVASNIAENRTTQLHESEEINNFALKVAKTFPISPILGIDILQDELTKQLYVLEVNAGGNVWHFSSTNGENYRFNLGGKNAMVRQYNAWDRAAEALIRKTHALAR